MTAPVIHGGPIGGECDCPLKPANHKGVQHSECCFHDEPGITACSCGGHRPDEQTPTPNLLLWLDLETTGTDETKDSIIEVGVVATTTDLVQIGEWTEVVHPTDQGLGRLLRTPPVRAMHEANGLLDLLLQEGDRHHTIGAVDFALSGWLAELAHVHGVTRWVLAGSGVGHFDRRFIRAWMPKLDRVLAHWCIDVGVVRRAYAMWTDTDEVHPEHVPGKTHRALDDAHFHLEEARMWRRMWQASESAVETQA